MTTILLWAHESISGGQRVLEKVSITHNFLSRRPFLSAVFIILLAILFFDIQGAIIKHLSQQYSVAQIAFFRNLFGMFPSILILLMSARWRSTGHSLRISRWTLALSRGLMILLAQIFLYTSFKYMEFATASTLAFSGPLFITLLSIPLLGHKVGVWRWLAVVLGFVGVLMIMRPGRDAFTLYAIYPVIAAFCYSLSSVCSRLFDDSEPTALIHLYAAVVPVILIAAYLGITASWQTVAQVSDWIWLIVMGGVGGMAILLLITAYRLVDPGSLSPFEYFGIPFSFALGWVFFDESPIGTLFPGVLLIIAAGLLIFWRERQLNAVS